MNWKMILGLLLIFGGLKELLSIMVAYNAGEFSYSPIGAILGTMTLIGIGIYVFVKGKKSKPKY